jgi:hypothetical protein
VHGGSPRSSNHTEHLRGSPSRDNTIQCAHPDSEYRTAKGQRLSKRRRGGSNGRADRAALRVASARGLAPTIATRFSLDEANDFQAELGGHRWNCCSNGRLMIDGRPSRSRSPSMSRSRNQPLVYRVVRGVDGRGDARKAPGRARPHLGTSHRLSSEDSGSAES